MQDSENGGKGEIKERNRTVVNLPSEKVEREVLSRVRRMRDGGPVIRALIAAAVPWLARAMA
jgi:hypothetical protein